MFFDVQRLPDVQSMIMNAEGTQRMLNSLEQLEKADATGRLDGYALSDKEKDPSRLSLQRKRKLKAPLNTRLILVLWKRFCLCSALISTDSLWQ